MKNIIKNAIILTLITLVAGSALAFVYSITNEPIAQAEIKATQEAYKTVFDIAEEFKELELAEYNDENGAVVSAVSSAVKGDEAIGFVMTTAAKGYGGDIKVAVGINKNGALTGISILDASNETPGLGAKVKEDDFTSQFAGVKASELDSQVDAISGATFSTNGVKNAVNAAFNYFEKNLKEGV
ncbi:MAG: RnfABCDGE type electron transport complex subunit G [Clostridia bacterium]|nr:RnfABCDGE type electron transport complex subunit G [Clostridia bacterium]